MNNDNKSSIFWASVNMFKGFIGIGVLSLPTAFSKSGYLCGTLLMLVCAFMIIYLSLQLISFANKSIKHSKSLVQFCENTLAYVVFFTTYSNQIFCFFSCESIFCTNRNISLIVSIILVFPLIFIRNINKLKSLSMYSNILVLTSLLIISIYCLKNLVSKNFKSEAVVFNVQNFGQSIGVFIFTFEGIGLYFEVRDSMQNPNQFNIVLKYSFGLALFLYWFIAFLGYLSFGNQLKDLIIFNLPVQSQPFLIFIQMFYCIALLLSYPIQVLPLVNIAEEYLREKLIKEQYGDKKELDIYMEQRKYENEMDYDNNLSYYNQNIQLNEKDMKQLEFKGQIIRVMFMIVIFFTSFFINKVSNFIGLIGCICGIVLSTVIPVLVCNICIENISTFQKNFNWFMMFLGIFFGLFGIYSSLQVLII
ncbi:transmembrane amino acid transporter protein, putative [Ichthyophthirius multifiliis]|uniref:Transmembrane amino acid transporter protein, putative n=1 Tax=Ichthyophthirius multifiliis TaxID=5932 RepID=G0R306_ICHMU|nr:transmembrane amino acid transporter protein, putative [Ichthyophthirius multifiliis]EGR28138.1 transmembrane amino acid transporter protein, putative [Ichthyophthirius multifiliis]|eukprot:XP_004027483.1 transmembrane amino acid transporter protein, putative [Ichthyophthirius multifiliis]